MGKAKLLVLNGSHSEIPLIESAKNLGFHVITTGNSPDLIGHKYADEYQFADFSDKEEILTLSKQLKIDAVCSCANDFGIITSAFIAEQLGLPGHDSYDTTLKIHHKDLFKIFCKKNAISTPHAETLGIKDVMQALSRKEGYNFPLLVKPIDLTGGKGITKVRSAEDLKNAIYLALRLSRAKRIVIEEFFNGTQHSFSTFIQNQKVVFYFNDNEFSYKNPYLVSTSSAPSTNFSKHVDQLIGIAELMADRLRLVDGVLHMQYLANETTFTIIEITRRCSGDLYPYPVSYACDIDWARWIVSSETGLDCDDFPVAKQSGYYGRHCIMASKNGVIDDVIISDYIKNNIVKKIVWWKSEDVIENHLSEKLGVLILKYSSKQEMLEKTSTINDLIYVDIK